MYEQIRRSTDDAELPGITGSEKLPSVAIVILNWNGRNFLKQFLPSVLASTYPNKRIIVADNASSDDSVAFLQQHFPAVEILQHATNEGFAKGYNSALEKIQSDYYILLNSDVEVEPGWIQPVISLMQNDHTIGACQPKLLSYTHRREFEYAGASGGWLDTFGYPFSRGRIFDIVEEDNGQYNDAEPCFWASGAAMFVRSELYHSLGGLDEYFFAHQEEIDFCWRMQLAGYKVYVQPQSIVYHVGGGTLPKQNNLKVFLNFRNNLIMMAKNFTPGEILWKVPFRMLLDTTAAWKGLLEGNGGYFVAITRAHIHFARWIFTKKKRRFFPQRKNTQLYGWYAGSAVWQHFVKKKTTFSEIVGSK
ncbi:glycosyltransferase family 2 protein [Ferruginibacter lapsinanis]|uniref:glycosyltransferase family 2 protein n=1 Tax=Ferruginibacter lapsinanis TaxID=563172 RepID=UPI001E62112B|nr:glycosyltransferase family 2 protein [Ferruginibacter lapsinanis]UEG49889.1 glycosyltransferase family 2 protein [Ferruginibacter lapsinanis]